ncbi:sigma-54 interaction domain-containing protein [Propionispira raffinosivorans]|uniref:sigma-54 interaction domain-containing protein n=1 Tax=Propionispira raffinosivorans TaxID=86959 RepID=UPI00037AA76C|nr:sigma 54-interacting transcriptional regulator [Propionispira raffinosivorans]
MKPRVAVILRCKRFHFVYQLQALLGEYIDFTSYSLEEGIHSYINCDLALTPSNEVVGLVKQYLMPSTEIIVVRRTVSKNAWEKINKIPAGTKVLVVNTYWEMSVQTIAVLYELGLYQFEFIPYDHTVNNYEGIEYAITPNEVDLVPESIQYITDIGSRLVDVSTIFDMLNKLNLVNVETKHVLFQHMNEMIPLSPGFVTMFKQFYDTKENFEQLVNMITYGVITFDTTNQITMYNQKAFDFFAHKISIRLNQTLDALFYDIADSSIVRAERLTDEVFILYGHAYIVNKNVLLSKGETVGGILTLQKSAKENKDNFKIQRSSAAKGYTAKYNFSDILGNNSALKKTIELAQKAASTEHDILIEGESGVGKELFAQSIHNYSKRSQGPFVAFNCAALSGSLLESELFGYEEGAFTGANKNGRQGLFETANQGTIFLDEIAEISQKTQAKLLRVLQERELIRVGGTKIIPIDVRIITATNQDLYKRMNKKKFRMDLYFRLNVINIKVEPLRSRKDDIPFLVQSFLQENYIKSDIPQNIMQRLLSYNWPGNIRELKNCLYSMTSLSDSFSLQSLPAHILNYGEKERMQVQADVSAWGDLTEIKAILRILEDAYENQSYIGRKKIAEQLLQQGIFSTEQSVRTILKNMELKNLILMKQGRGGTRITDKGREFIRVEAH